MTDLPANARSKRTQADKVRRAAAHPDRPGAGCKAPAGSMKPVVDRAKCEGKSDCVAVCPYDVFDVTRIAKPDYDALPFVARLKVRFHGMQTSYTPRAELCQGCGLCVVACPEGAIRLT